MSRSKVKKTYAPRPCAYDKCGVLFTPIREWAKFCSPECRRAAAREKAGGWSVRQCGTRIE